jgi:AcrR family transcriptional regulator
LRTLAGEIGIAAPSIYRHFPDKAALLVAVAEAEFEAFHAVLVESSAAGGDDPFERLRSAGRGYLRFAAERPAHYRILFGGVGLPCGREPSEYLQESGRTSFDTLVGLVQDCLDTRPVGAGIDAFAVATEIWTMMHGLVDLPFGNPTFPWPDRQGIADQWLDRFRASLSR